MQVVGVAIYLLVLLIIGFVASRRMFDTRDFFAGGKRLGYWVAAFSARATGESAWLLLGLSGMGAAVGVHAFWVVIGEVLGVCGAWLLMSQRFKRLTDQYDSITIPDYLESRFRDAHHHLRLVAAFALVIFVTVYVSAQIDATGTAFNSFLGWNYYVGALVGFGVVMIYIVAGGFLAVVWSDVFQGTMMILGLVGLPIVGLAAAGGVQPVLDGLRAQDPELLSLWGPGGWNALTPFTILSLALIGLGYLGSPQVFVRFLAIRSDRELSRGAAVAITWTLLADTGAVVIGMVGRHLLMGPNQIVQEVLGSGGQEVLPLLVDHLLPALWVGMFIAIVLAAIMSTVDSLLVVASSAAVRDYYQKVRHPNLHDDALIGVSRRTTAVLALVALTIAMLVAVIVPGRTIFWFVIFGWSGISATFCPTIILSLFWSGFTASGALAAMITGFACVPVFKFLMPQLPVVGGAFGALTELPPSFLLAGIAGVLVSLADAKGREHVRAVIPELKSAASGQPASPSTP